MGIFDKITGREKSRLSCISFRTSTGPSKRDMQIMRDDSRDQRVLKKTHPLLRAQKEQEIKERRVSQGVDNEFFAEPITLRTVHEAPVYARSRESQEAPKPLSKPEQLALKDVSNTSIPVPTTNNSQTLAIDVVPATDDSKDEKTTTAPPSTQTTEEFRQRDEDPELRRGPFETFEVPKDIYSASYIIAKNATPALYSFWPWYNKHMWKLWGYLFFIAFSQIFVIVMFVFWFPPVVHSETMWKKCENFEDEGCTEEDFNGITADVNGEPTRYYQEEREYEFHERVFSPAPMSINILRCLAFSWILSQVFLRDYKNIVQILKFRDFNTWFLPRVDETPRNFWAITIPALQFVNAVAITCVAICVICAYENAFDIVMNSLAFSFLGELPEIFADPLIEYMGSTKLDQIPEDWGDIYYIVPEYTPEDDYLFTEPTWYTRRHAEKPKAGLIYDFEYRWNPDLVPQTWERHARILKTILLSAPILTVVLCWAFALQLDSQGS